MTKTTNQELLLPDRHPQNELFICDVADAIIKDIMPQMEHPFYSLSKKPETSVRRYEHKGNWLEIIPSVKGLATIYDKDILIYCISQIMHKLNKGEKVSREVRLSTRDLLIFTNRGTAGKDYKAFSEALERLGGTRISTNIRVDDEEQFDTFGLIEKGQIKRKVGKDGRVLWVDITLSDWVFDAIKDKDVLTLHPNYFRLRKPIERRMYEVARKICGSQDSWKMGLDILHKRSGSRSSLKEFRRSVKGIVDGNHLPDYFIEYIPSSDEVIFKNRGTMKQDIASPSLPNKILEVSEEALEKARAVAPGYDKYALLAEFREFWTTSGKPELKSVDGAFIGFCKKHYKENPLI